MRWLAFQRPGKAPFLPWVYRLATILVLPSLPLTAKSWMWHAPGLHPLVSQPGWLPVLSLSCLLLRRQEGRLQVSGHRPQTSVISARTLVLPSGQLGGYSPGAEPVLLGGRCSEPCRWAEWAPVFPVTRARSEFTAKFPTQTRSQAFLSLVGLRRGSFCPR